MCSCVCIQGEEGGLLGEGMAMGSAKDRENTVLPSSI